MNLPREINFLSFHIPSHFQPENEVFSPVSPPIFREKGDGRSTGWAPDCHARPARNGCGHDATGRGRPGSGVTTGTQPGTAVPHNRQGWPGYMRSERGYSAGTMSWPRSSEVGWAKVWIFRQIRPARSSCRSISRSGQTPEPLRLSPVWRRLSATA